MSNASDLSVSECEDKPISNINSSSVLGYLGKPMPTWHSTWKFNTTEGLNMDLSETARTSDFSFSGFINNIPTRIDNEQADHCQQSAQDKHGTNISVQYNCIESIVAPSSSEDLQVYPKEPQVRRSSRTKRKTDWFQAGLYV